MSSRWDTGPQAGQPGTGSTSLIVVSQVGRYMPSILPAVNVVPVRERLTISSARYEVSSADNAASNGIVPPLADARASAPLYRRYPSELVRFIRTRVSKHV